MNTLTVELAGLLARSGKLRYSRKVKTATFDGRQILINPKWFGGLNMAQKFAVIDHEVAHYAVANGLT